VRSALRGVLYVLDRDGVAAVEDLQAASGGPPQQVVDLDVVGLSDRQALLDALPGPVGQTAGFGVDVVQGEAELGSAASGECRQPLVVAFVGAWHAAIFAGLAGTSQDWGALRRKLDATSAQVSGHL
jgi:hypothetical protein